MSGKGEEAEYGDGVAWVRSSMIGKGSFGRVYKATLRNPRNTSLPPLMAVKSAEVSSSGSIQKEREVYSNLGGCRYIIHCYGDEITIDRNGAMVFNLLLEYGCGGNLSDRMKKSKLSELEARYHTRSILRGLRHIHDFGYVHCDLKPDNILLVENSRRRYRATGFRAKIGDFGLAKRVKKRKLGQSWEGTPRYLSPEAVMDHVQEAPSDVWALGCIVMEMLTGKSPLGEGEAVDVLRKIGMGIKRVEIPNEVSKEAKAFLKGCFVKTSSLRLTCEMLLNHSFLEGLDDDAVDESESFGLVCGSDDEFSSESWSDESEGDSWCGSSQEEAESWDIDEEKAKEMSKHMHFSRVAL